MNNQRKEDLKEAMDVHVLWHALCKYLRRWYFTLCYGIKFDLTPSKRQYRDVAFDKVVGYRAMKRLDQFSKKHPGMISVGCDDNTHSGSSIYLIPHEAKNDYMGTTLLFVPQVSSDRNVLFFYPYELDNLICELQKLQKRQRSKKKNR